MTAARKLLLTEDRSSPEFLGALSTVGAWRAVLRNPYTYGSALWHRWQVAREAALGIRQERFRPVEVRDRQIDPLRFHYDTDKR